MVHKHELMAYWKDHFGFTERELDAFIAVDRAEFVPSEYSDVAYEDRPLPLIRGKTISQPTTVMIMTSALEIKEGDVVLEVGTGSGYQSAILSHLVGSSGKVVSTEVIPELVMSSRDRLQRLSHVNVLVFEEDGSLGKKEYAPYDKMIITCACKEFPGPLVEQLKVGGVIVGPVGTADEQEMVRATKDKNGKLEMEFLGQFIFTPMIGKYGFER